MPEGCCIYKLIILMNSMNRIRRERHGDFLFELRHLRTCWRWPRCGNVSAAARRLNLTQSALSHQLKTLESHYGCALVDRRRQPLALHRRRRAAAPWRAACWRLGAAAERELARIAQGGPASCALPWSATPVLTG